MVFSRALKYLPFGENMQVFLGVGIILGIGYYPFYKKGAAAAEFDTMAEKQEAMRLKQEAMKHQDNNSAR